MFKKKALMDNKFMRTMKRRKADIIPAFTAIVITVVVMIYCIPKSDEMSYQDAPQTSREIFLISTDWMQEPIAFSPSRFANGKKIQYISLCNGDSVTLFIPSQTMSEAQYEKWLGRNTINYECTHSWFG